MVIRSQNHGYPKLAIESVKSKLLLFFAQPANVLLVLLAPFFSAPFVFKFPGRQYRRAGPGPQLVFFNRYFVGLVWHLDQ